MLPYSGQYDQRIKIIFANMSFREQVQCKGGKWTEIQDCHRGTCHGGNDGGAVC